ncbi:putative transmembrane protein [Toxoplasma gondii GAB2-2007-GAL-DOM2]|uniref:Putative transmembrane protein n=2 Tax=Toxoplasma gondii TaxID=5811 RepID=A0A086LBP8_TOXGO|nr:putative transmembrane protein [Toxoplasma gondii GAB2-2007-GAL-DOM2]KFG54066.1 putative transmembrane protein [Toxoplasma gondii FOU]
MYSAGSTGWHSRRASSPVIRNVSRRRAKMGKLLQWVSRPCLFVVVAVLCASLSSFSPDPAVTSGEESAGNNQRGAGWHAVGTLTGVVLGVHAAQPALHPEFFSQQYAVGVQSLEHGQVPEENDEPSAMSTLGAPEDNSAVPLIVTRRRRTARFPYSNFAAEMEQEGWNVGERALRRGTAGNFAAISDEAALVATIGSRKKVIFNLSDRLSLHTRADGTVVCATGGVAATATAGDVRRISFDGKTGYVTQASGPALSFEGSPVDPVVLPLSHGTNKSVTAGSSLLVLCTKPNEAAVAIPGDKPVTVKTPVVLRKALEARERRLFEERASHLESYARGGKTIAKVAAFGFILFALGFMSAVSRFAAWGHRLEADQSLETVYRVLADAELVPPNEPLANRHVIAFLADTNEEHRQVVLRQLYASDPGTLLVYKEGTRRMRSAVVNAVLAGYSMLFFFGAYGVSSLFNHAAARNRRRSRSRRHDHAAGTRTATDRDDEWVNAGDADPLDLGDADIVIADGDF